MLHMVRENRSNTFGRGLVRTRTRNWALTREQALNAIDKLRDANVAVLGGDVLSGPDESYRHTYNNWYFEPSTPSIDSDVVSSGALKASTYVRSYPHDDAYFVLVARDA